MRTTLTGATDWQLFSNSHLIGSGCQWNVLQSSMQKIHTEYSLSDANCSFTSSFGLPNVNTTFCSDKIPEQFKIAKSQSLRFGRRNYLRTCVVHDCNCHEGVFSIFLFFHREVCHWLPHEWCEFVRVMSWCLNCCNIRCKVHLIRLGIRKSIDVTRIKPIFPTFLIKNFIFNKTVIIAFAGSSISMCEKANPGWL